LNEESQSILKLPPFLLSIILQKTEDESNCGKQHQSIEESLFINAEDLQFPIIP
jgi:hypothetical protein